jgi:serine/threonine protein kinase
MGVHDSTGVESGRFMEPAIARLIGRQVGAYEILSPLGAGGMGEVYRARDTKLGRDVGIKVLPAAFCSGREAGANFFIERPMAR